MQILVWIAYFCWVVAAAMLIWAIGDENPILIFAALSAAISGAVFFAFDRAISLLTDIRDALAPGHPEGLDKPSNEMSSAQDAETPSRSIGEISADLKRLKSSLE